MIQVKEFIDTNNSLAVNQANAFLAELREEDVVNVRYGTFTSRVGSGSEYQRSTILVVYRKSSTS